MVSFVLAVLVGAGILCNGAQGQTGLSASDKDELLIAHNYFRGIVDPIAANMERMVSLFVDVIKISKCMH